MRVAQEEALGGTQAGTGECVGDGGPLIAVETVHPKPLGDSLVHRPARIECPGGILQDQLCAAPVLLERPR